VPCWDRGRPARNERKTRNVNLTPLKTARLRRVGGRDARGPRQALETVDCRSYPASVSIEIEKRYRLTKKQREAVLQRLPEIGATRKLTEFEENTLYKGESLDPRHSVLRLRHTGKRALLTFKERFPTRSDIKHQREDETAVADPDAMELILEALGFTAGLIYEKRRETWILGKTEIVIDELPFGLFMEIEGAEQEIRRIESELTIKGLRTEPDTYPQLTLKHGRNHEGVIEARFPRQ